MFRAATAGPFDEGVAKATDENLTSEDWGAIIEVCDRVGSDQNGPKEVVQAMIKRLAHRNANVQLYTLELANALSQNCGKNMHRELSSRAFTDAMLKLANDRNTHNQVKAKILERMKEWSDMFSKDADLGIMYDAYFRLKQSNPTLQAPSAPQKTGLTELDRQKEEDELQMALKLSLQEEERKKKSAEPAAATSSSAATATGPSSQAAQSQIQSTPVPAGTTAATVSRVRALYDFVPSEPGELEFKKGDVIAVLESVYKDWWRGSLKGKTGIFPLNYVEKLTDPTPDELAREAQMEAEVFAEIKNVEKLLTLLSASNTAPREEDNEEISKLYHQTLAIRPKLIKLIEKYSQKKDDFTQLNEKFIKARRDYESLLESSMSHPPQPSYHQYAMRPGPGGYPPGPGAGYPQGPSQQQQPEQRYYTPAPQEQPQYPQSTPSPNFQRPVQATPAPFYVAGAEVPSAGGQPSAQPQQYPQREHGQRLPSTGKAPAPINTSPPPPANTYTAYSQPPNQRPQSTYGAQELATSVYDSPIANHNPNSAATYTSSVYSQDDPYSNNNNLSSPVIGNSTVAAPPPSSFQPSAPTGKAPVQSSQPPQPHQSQYQSYQPSSAAGQDNYSAAPTQAPPPVPTGAAPPIPGAGRSETLTPPPLQPGGPAYDARQGLPSQTSQPQYRAYVPPGVASDGPSAPPANDYYRQSGVY